MKLKKVLLTAMTVMLVLGAAACSSGTKDKDSGNSIKGEIVLEDSSVNEDIAFLPLGMYMSIKEVKDGVATVEIDNQSGYEMSFSEYFSLEKEENGEWVEVPPAKDMAFTDDLKVIKDLEKVEVTCDLRMFGDLEVGKYRLIKDDMMANFEIK